MMSDLIRRDDNAYLSKFEMLLLGRCNGMMSDLIRMDDDTFLSKLLRCYHWSSVMDHGPVSDRSLLLLILYMSPGPVPCWLGVST